MSRPHGLLRAGYPYLMTLGMRRVTNFPTDVAFGLNGEIYILMRAEGFTGIRIWSLDDAEELSDDLKTIGGYGTDDGQFEWPVNLITNKNGDLLVSDESTHRITKFNKNGEFVSKFGEIGNSEGELNGPSGISFDNNGNLLVVDSKNHRIQRFSESGEYISSFGSFGSDPGQFNLPWGIDVDENGDIYVVDWGNNRIQIFYEDGNLKSVFGELGTGDGQFDRPSGVAVDIHGDIYVSDWGNNRVVMFNSEGHYLWSFTGDATLSKVARTYMMTNASPNRMRESGRIENERYLRRPRSVRVDDQFRLFIPDYESYRLQVYQKDFIELDESQIVAPLRNPTLDVV